MVTMRVSRRTAIVAAAGWVAAPVRAEDGFSCAGEEALRAAATKPEPAPGRAGREQVFVLYRELARFLRDPDPDRLAALRRALGTRTGAAALAAYGDALPEFLLEQTDGLTAVDATWAERADAADVPGQVRDGLRQARRVLAAGETPPVYLIFSRRFDGRADGRAIFVGVDRFGTERLSGQVALLTAHEYNHIVRARAASFARLLDAIIAEGLATACSELAQPGRPLHDYLLYTPAQLAWFTPARLALLWEDLAAGPACPDPHRRRAYLGGCDGPRGAPPRGGYYLGYLLVRAWLDRGVSIAQLTRMPADQIWAGGRYARS